MREEAQAAGETARAGDPFMISLGGQLNRPVGLPGLGNPSALRTQAGVSGRFVSRSGWGGRQEWVSPGQREGRRYRIQQLDGD